MMALYNGNSVQLIAFYKVICLLFSLEFVCCQYRGVSVRRIDFFISNRFPKEDNSIQMMCDVTFDEPVIHMVVQGAEDIFISIQKNSVPFARNYEVTDNDFANRTNAYIEPVTIDRVYLIADISTVSRNDTGIYSCLVHDENNMEISDTRASNRNRVLALTVRYYPMTSFPQCSASPQRVHLGGQVTIWCTSEEANPPVTLQWRSQDNAANKSAQTRQVQTRQNGFVRSELTLTTTLSYVSDEYTCEIRSSEFPHELRTCVVSVQPVWPVSLSVHPSEASVSTGESVEFTCRTIYVFGNNEKWEWILEPPIAQSRLHISGNSLLINKTEIGDNMTSVSCFALFESQWFESTPAMLLVKQIHSTDENFENGDAQDMFDLSQNVSAPLWLILAFVVTIVVCVSLIALTIFLIFKIIKRKQGIVVLDKPASKIATNAYRANKGSSSYMGLQRSSMSEQEEYTELNTANSKPAEQNAHAYAKSITGVEMEEEMNYSYAETSYVKPNVFGQRTYGNILT